MDMVLKAQAKKKGKTSSKKQLFCIKGHFHQSEKATHRMGENICKSYIWQSVNLQIIKNSYKYNSTKSKTPRVKNERRT